MTTIRLGAGADSVDVEDGASVPLANGKRASVHRYDGVICVKYDGAIIASIDTDTGIWWNRGAHIDLAALRRERAPKIQTVGCWASGVPTIEGHYTTIYCLREPGRNYPDYWTSRPGNTPELQAAFDAAVEMMMERGPSYADINRPVTHQDVAHTFEFMKAAKALGYGKP